MSLANTPQDPPEQPPIPVESAPAAPRPLAEAWFGMAVGLILLALQHRFLSYLTHLWLGTKFDWVFNNEAGQPIDYSQSVFFWHDIGLVVFALAVLADGALLLMRRPKWLTLATLAMTILATGLNLWTVLRLFGAYGPQYLPMIAVAFGVYVVILHLQRRAA